MRILLERLETQKKLPVDKTTTFKKASTKTYQLRQALSFYEKYEPMKMNDIMFQSITTEYLQKVWAVYHPKAWIGQPGSVNRHKEKRKYN